MMYTARHSRTSDVRIASVHQIYQKYQQVTTLMMIRTGFYTVTMLYYNVMTIDTRSLSKYQSERDSKLILLNFDPEINKHQIGKIK